MFASAHPVYYIVYGVWSNAHGPLASRIESLFQPLSNPMNLLSGSYLLESL